MATALDVIKSSLRLIGAFSSGETLDVGEANDALDVLNDMIDSWNTDRLAIFTTRIDTFPFILGQQDYTLGTGGDFDMPRPAQIDAMSSILLTNPDNPVEVPIVMLTVDQWQTQVPVKNVDGTFPLQVYDDGGFPFRKLSFWPIPSQQPSSARIYSWQGLNQPATLATVIAFPPGYPEAFRYNLAIRLAPEYERPVPPSVQQIAVESLARLKTINAPDLNLQSDLMPWPAGYNYRADLFGIAW
jgi:hypothetical protein